MTIKVIVSRETPQWDESIPEEKQLMEKTIKAVLDHLKWDRAAEVSVVLTTDREMQELNALHRHQDKPTNVLSFPSFDDPDEDPIVDPEHPVLLGDLVFAYGIIEREAQEQQKSFSDHFTHLIVHGMLHLMGFDHEEDEEAEEMEALEVEILRKLSIPDPYNPLQDSKING